MNWFLILVGVFGIQSQLSKGAGVHVPVDRNKRLVSSLDSNAGKNTRLTYGTEPAFSPDGRKIAYECNGKIWLIDINGQHPIQIGQCVGESRPAFSPDGKRIAFQCYGKGPSRAASLEIWVMNSDGTAPHRLASTAEGQAVNGQIPRWSPDGKYVAFTHGKNIWVTDSSGSHAHPVTKDTPREWEYLGDWSPDGQFIGYLRVDDYRDYIGPQGKIWFAKPDGSNTRIFSDELRAYQARWSRDGKHLYYSDLHTLWKIDSEGRNPPRRLFECKRGRNLIFFDISSDERWITYDDQDADNESSIYIDRLDQNP